ncbi:hypothetical protein HBI62_228890 [Parastagonospora nodorum]|nr:hypothetical protein HBI62_228890 [Parastagonospora nodorum]KAH6137425.1 hypothetical protein HBI63_224310 [Parastagonospora nodorum]KAH6162048.1 hypothetical protein HBI61_226310 [Parastagonospora nodorum]
MILPMTCSGRAAERETSGCPKFQPLSSRWSRDVEHRPCHCDQSPLLKRASCTPLEGPVTRVEIALRCSWGDLIVGTRQIFPPNCTEGAAAERLQAPQRLLQSKH